MSRGIQAIALADGRAIPKLDRPRAEAAVRELLLAVGEDPDRDGLRETPARVARAYAEIFAGLYADPDAVLDKTFDENHRELVLVRDIPISSLCEHHLLPFNGVAHVGYIPGCNGHVTGLSKIARLVDLYARRPQVQERITGAGRGRAGAQAGPAGRDRRDRRGAPLHGDARHPQARFAHHHVRSARAVPDLGLVAGRGDGADPAVTGPAAGTGVDLPRPGRCAVLGILNVTPDSFSDGGRFLDLDHAVDHGITMRTAGADLVDVGGESTRPGAGRIDAAEELRRVLPVVRELVAEGVPVSIDTTRSAVAEAALEAGATVVNDVSGGLADPAMARVVAQARVPWILMHWRGHSDRMGGLATYEDVLGEVRAELVARVDAAVLAGVDPGRIVLDPGLGFAKTAAHNWALLRRLDVLLALGFPVLVGASRKRFLGQLLAGDDGTPRAPAGREVATAAITALVATAGAWGVRVHDVASSMDAVAVASAIQLGASPALDKPRRES